MPGAACGPYLPKHGLEFNAQLRAFQSRRHFSGTAEQTQRAFLGNNVINTQRMLDLGLTYALNERSNLQLTVPLMQGWFNFAGNQIKAGNQTILLSRAGNDMYAGGLGDISLTYNRWMRDPVSHPNSNIMLGLGFMFPTGQSNVSSTFLRNNALLTVASDTSIQPGTGSFGYIFQMQGFRTLNKTMALYYSGSYLAETAGTSHTKSLLAAFNVNNPDEALISIMDQYAANIGVAYGPPRIPGLVLTLGGHYEAVPQVNLIGNTVGFRRPGYTVSVEPGVNYTYHGDTWSFSAPITIMRDRQDTVANGNDFAGDATVADVVFNFGFKHRFGAGADFKAVEPKTSLLLPPTHADYSQLDNLGRTDVSSPSQFVTSSELERQEQKSQAPATPSSSTGLEPQSMTAPSTDPAVENAIQHSMVDRPVSANNL